ncbi:MAG: hypothetical protein D6806_01115 [Deltaproteobacteria bacterium]|nr:MAG: hypothetical protein D6806_01115 [Deltaproteobacteria bacterium]
MKRRIDTLACLMFAVMLTAFSGCSGSGGSQCQEGEGASLTISTSPPSASIPADGNTKLRVTVVGQDENCERITDANVTLTISDRVPENQNVGYFLVNGEKSDSIELPMTKFGASTDIRASEVGTATLTAFVPAYNLTALPVQMEFTTPPVTGQCGVTVEIQPKFIEADGQSTATVTATLHSDSGGPMPDGTPVTFTTTAGEFVESNDTTHDAQSIDSVATATIRSVQLPEDQTMGATITVSFVCDDGLEYSNHEDVTFGHQGQPWIDLVSDKNTILADGVDKTLLTATIYLSDGSTAPAGTSVEFFIMNDGAGYFEEAGPGQSSYTATTDDTGAATVNFMSTEPGTSTISANALVDGVSVRDEVSVNIRALGNLLWISTDPDKLGIEGSGRDESAEVVFQVLDTNDNPISGVLVNFEHSLAPGVTLSPTSATSGADGLVKTTLSSGPTPATVTVTAKAQMGAVSKEAPSPPIVIVGAKPSATNMTLACSVLNFGAFLDSNWSILAGAQVECTVFLVDRFGNPVGFAHNVLFATEAGSVVGTAVSSEKTEDMGQATTIFTTTSKIPWDVEPIADEPRVFSSFGAICSPGDDSPCRDAGIPQTFANKCTAANTCSHSYNPRDGLVTIIAATSGEEGFVDNNFDNVYTPGVDEPINISDPFVDADDNGMFSPPQTGRPGEPYIDANNDGVFTPADARPDWDSDTMIWRSIKLAWTGPVATGVGDCSTPSENRYSVLCSTQAPFDTFAVVNGETVDLHWEVKDFNLNPLNASVQVSAQVEGKGRIVSSNPTLPLRNVNVTQGDWYNCGGGLCGTITITSTNNGDPNSAGTVKVNVSWRDAATVGDQHTTTLVISGDFL